MNIEVILGDITRVKVDAIVNAANSRLAGGGGVDGAIHRAGGPSIMKECDTIREKQGGCPAGQAVITTAGNLPAKKVIHTVGPVWNGGKQNESEILASAYTSSLTLAAENELRSVAFPNISTGIYGFPKKEAAKIAVNTVKKILACDKRVHKVVFVCFDEDSIEIYKSLLKENMSERQNEK